MSALEFRNVDDLAGVISEMLGYVVGRIQPGYVKALNFISPRQRIIGELRQHPARMPDCPAQLRDEHLAGNGPSLREFAVAFPPVIRPAEARNNPLPDISAEMQDEIAGAVGRRIWPPPNVLFQIGRAS